MSLILSGVRRIFTCFIAVVLIFSSFGLSLITSFADVQDETSPTEQA